MGLFQSRANSTLQSLCSLSLHDLSHKTSRFCRLLLKQLLKILNLLNSKCHLNSLVQILRAESMPKSKYCEKRCFSFFLFSSSFHNSQFTIPLDSAHHPPSQAAQLAANASEQVEISIEELKKRLGIEMVALYCDVLLCCVVLCCVVLCCVVVFPDFTIFQHNKEQLLRNKIVSFALH